MSTDGPFRFRVSATPLSTEILVIREDPLPEVVDDLAIPLSGEVMFDFRQHRGKVISFSLTQEYTTANGTVTSDLLAFVNFPVPLY